MKLKYLSLILVIASTTISCTSYKKFQFTSPKVEMSAVTNIDKDVTYKTVGDSAIKLDIYTNRNDSDRLRPVVVCIHGGSWIHGSKNSVLYSYSQAICNSMINEHYAVISVDYRLADGKNITFKQELDDCRDAIKWVRRNAAKYHFDSHRVGLWGGSAGAHIALVIGYLPTDSTDVRFVMDDYGPTNLNKLFRNELTPIGLGMAHLVLPKMYNARKMMLRVFPDDYCTRYSPVNLAKRYAVPTLIQHGDKDGLVPIKQSYELESILARRGIQHRMFVYPGAFHAFPNFTQQQIDDAAKHSIEFVRECFK
jgi:acetyl esterase/lipase